MHTIVVQSVHLCLCISPTHQPISDSWIRLSKGADIVYIRCSCHIERDGIRKVTPKKGIDNTCICIHISIDFQPIVMYVYKQ